MEVEFTHSRHYFNRYESGDYFNRFPYQDGVDLSVYLLYAATHGGGGIEDAANLAATLINKGASR